MSGVALIFVPYSARTNEDQKLTEEGERIKLVTCEADIAGSYAQGHNAVHLHEIKYHEIYYPPLILFSEMYEVLYT